MYYTGGFWSQVLKQAAKGDECAINTIAVAKAFAEKEGNCWYKVLQGEPRPRGLRSDFIWPQRIGSC